MEKVEEIAKEMVHTHTKMLTAEIWNFGLRGSPRIKHHS